MVETMSNEPAANTATVQVRLLERLRAHLGKTWKVSPIVQRDRYRHWEDEDLGVPPIERVASFTVGIAPLTVHVEARFPWPDRPADVVRASFDTYQDATAGAPWAIVADSPTTRTLSGLGFARLGAWYTEWALGGDERVLIDEIASRLERLERVPFRVLSAQSAPSDLPWPSRRLVELIGADALIDVGAEPDGRRRVTTELAGRRSDVTTIVTQHDLDLVRRWRGLLGAPG